VAKKEKGDKSKEKPGDEVVDLASRIGARPSPPSSSSDPPAPASKPVPPVDAMPPRIDAPLPPRVDAPLPSRRASDQPVESRSFSITPSEPPRPLKDMRDPWDDSDEKSEPIPSPRLPPGPGETDVVITPLPTVDDWHKFELALRRLRGVGQLRTEYYRHGVLKVRVTYEGPERLAQAIRAGVPGYRVRVIGEGVGTLQILVSSENDERRPG